MAVKSWRTLVPASVLVLAVLSASSAAYALADAQLLYGLRTYKTKDASGKNTDVAATQLTLAAHVDPIPLVPVAFGASFSMVDLDEGDLGSAVKEAALTEAALEVLAWVPMVPVITPYARFGFPVMSRLVQKYDIEVPGAGRQDYAVTSKLNGYHLNIGARYAVVPLVSLMVEYGMGMQKAEIDEFKVNGQKQTAPAGSDSDANSQAFIVGVQVGI